MSGTIVNNITRTSGTIAPTTGGLSWGSDVITGSTATVSAGNGYWINTTSNACTVTLPSSAEIGDQIILADYARTWSTNNLIIDSNGNNFQGSPDTFTVDYSTAGQSLSIVYSDATKGWIPVSDDAVVNAPVAPVTQRAIFGFGRSSGGKVSITNLVNSSGVVASDTTGVGTDRERLAAASYGFDKAIFGYGTSSGGKVSMTNLVSNSGVVASDTTGVGTVRDNLAAAGYGNDKAIFGYGSVGATTNLTNLVSNSGVVATDTAGVGTARENPAGTGFGADKAIFCNGSPSNVTNIVSNLGVVAADVSGVGTRRPSLAACRFGGDKAIMAYGLNPSSGAGLSMSNIISNTGVVAADVSGVGTARSTLAAASYGGNLGVFGYGSGPSSTSYVSNMTNKVSATGVIASDTSGVGTARSILAAAGYSTSA
jgi:hypothetical protein